MAGVLVLGFLTMASFLVLFYAWRRQRSAATEAKSTWLRVQIGAGAVATLLLGVTVVLLVLRH